MRPAAPATTGRGAERRAALLAATARVLGRKGLAGVTHRAVAEEARVPLAATTYYFSSKEELLTEALRMLATEEMVRLQTRAAELGPEQYRSPKRLAGAITDVLFPRSKREREAILAKYEVYLEAARSPILRATASQFIEGFRGVAAAALAAAGASEPTAKAPVLVAAIDGMLMHQLASGAGADSLAEERRRLERLIVALTS
jgi:TetR/AcrR family transcriptional regulator, regulator of biofilm formation and stress response